MTRLAVVLLLLAASGAVVWLCSRAPAPSAGVAVPGPASAPGGVREPELRLPATDRDLEPLATAPSPSREPAAPDRSGRIEVTPGEPRSGPLVVVALDRRTGEPLRFVEVEFAAPLRPRARVETDPRGRARSPDTLPTGGVRVTARDLLTRKRLERRAVLHQPAPDGGAAERTWELDVGPTYGLRVDTGAAPLEDPETGPLRARLRGTGADGERREWSWRELSAPDPDGTRWVRWPSVEREPAPGTPVSLQVELSGTYFGDELVVPGAVGLHEGLEVSLQPRFATLHGRVTDAEGRPAEARVLVLDPVEPGHAGDALELQEATDDEGRYRLEHVPSGPHPVLVLGPGGARVHAHISLTAGEVLERDFVLEAAWPSGSVSGTVIARPGSDAPLAWLKLEPLDGAGAVRWGVTRLRFWLDSDDRGGPERSAYAIEDVPLGRYRLSALAFDGRTYWPAQREVQVPAAEVDFEEVVAEPGSPLRVRVLDAESGAPIEGASCIWGLQDLWVLDVDEIDVDGAWPLPPGSGFQLVVGAPGHVPVRCSTADTVLDEGGQHLVVRLRRGHGAGLLVLPLESALLGQGSTVGEAFLARGVPAARVVVDGRSAGSVSPDGVALVEAGAPIESLRVEAPGWTTVDVRRFGGHAATPDGLGFVLMARE